ncbi:MAG: hypothetical protein WBF51_04095 [Candidatus Dormiibacterota bacterium]
MSTSRAKKHYRVTGTWVWGDLEVTLWAEDDAQAVEVGRILLERSRRPGALDNVEFAAQEMSLVPSGSRREGEK